MKRLMVGFDDSTWEPDRCADKKRRFEVEEAKFITLEEAGNSKGCIVMEVG